MRTTIRLDGDLLKQAKTVAAEGGQSLSQLVADALREALAKRKAGTQRKWVSLPTSSHGQGLLPGVDIDNSAALLDLMEQDDSSTAQAPMAMDNPDNGRKEATDAE